MNAPLKMPPAILPEADAHMPPPLDVADKGEQIDMLAGAERVLPASASPPASNPNPDAFDWFTDEAVVVTDQPAVAVYQNRIRAVVIRAESRSGDEDDDPVITLASKDAVRAVISALQRELKDMRDG